MTQPAPPTSTSSGNVIAAAALGLALITLEEHTRQQVEDTIADAYKTIAAVAIVAAAQPPAVVATGLALLAIPALHKAITRQLEQARARTTDIITAGYTAATQLAQTTLTDQLAETGYTVPDTLPELYPNLDALAADITTMFGHAQTNLQNDLAAAYDHSTDPAQRTINIQNASTAAQAGLRMRAQAAATTAIHQGATDAQQAIFTDYQNHYGVGLMKRWTTTSENPCGMCQALDGTLVAVSSTFDTDATTNTKDWRRPWRTLTGPPRHPNCRCQLELVHL